ncbi:hypothetical protein F5148DRAFT_1261604 [Russula earlei]|uniref:Uncharacterized protein n=1 Tax=Russula earlei TaxID=71964 RepID=A0ACC0TT45_9AGAM|nr:hypothetical protein F5148DRAFT_1261604 [Russula earlei]
MTLTQLRFSFDLVAVLFMYDEYTNAVDREGAHAYVEIGPDALRSPYLERPKGELMLGEIA